MKLRDLHYLVTVAEQLHFGRAAEICHTSQPTLSIQIKKLEEFLGVQLFERSNKQVMLTVIGQEMVAHARVMLAEAEQIKQIAKAAKNPLSGLLKLGAFPTLAPYIFPKIVPAIKDSLPQIELILIEEKTEQLIEKLLKGEIDCALLALPVEHTGLIAQEIFWEAFVLAMPRSHPLAKKTEISLADLAHQPMLLLDDGHCLRDQSLALCSRIGSGESNSYRATSLETLRNMIAAGNGMTFMPKLAIQESTAYIHYVPFKQPVPGRKIGLLYRKSSARIALFDRLGKVFRDSLAEH